MTIKRVTVAGSGVLGSQIAFQTAYKGFEVTIYDIDEQAIERGKAKIKHLASLYKDEILVAKNNYSEKVENLSYNKNLLPKLDDVFLEKVNQSLELVEELPREIHFSTDLAKAVEEADLVIEAVPEQAKVKKDFYQKLSHLAPKKLFLQLTPPHYCQVNLHK